MAFLYVAFHGVDFGFEFPKIAAAAGEHVALPGMKFPCRCVCNQPVDACGVETVPRHHHDTQAFPHGETADPMCSTRARDATEAQAGPGKWPDSAATRRTAATPPKAAAEKWLL